MKYVCSLCGFEYDEEKGYPEGGIAPGTPWDELPEDFLADDDEEPVEFELVFGDVPELDFVVPDEGDFDDDDDDD